MPDQNETARPRGFWSGTLSFGLVSVPVSLFAATRGSRVSLRMVDESGQPLSRVYFCSKDDAPLTPDDIVRGYELEKDHFVVVEDHELDAIAPDKSQEISLQRFVDATEIDPVYFERGYFLAPGKGGARPYRLLARAMEDAGRAGVATFVMRGKEYLVAIMAEGGLLRAETLRFHDELRSPRDVGLPELTKADPKRRRAMEQDLRKLRAERLDESLVSDAYAAQLQQIVDDKLRRGRDVRRAPEALEPSERESAEIIDLMQVLKRSVEEKAPAGAGDTGARKRKRPRSAGPRSDLENKSKSELYEQAQRLEIAGRGAMNKRQLIEAIRQAQ